MALPSTGPISFADIQTEFGGTNPIGLNEYYGVATGIPTSGAISMEAFRGASASTIVSGLSSVIASYTGQYSTTLYQQVDLSSLFSQYLGRTGRLVFQYVSGSSYTGDIQLDDVNIGSNNYGFEATGSGWQTTVNDTSDATITDAFYQGLGWVAVAISVTASRWNMDIGGTGSSGTGIGGADEGSYYLYVETSSPAYPNKVMWLRSPEITLDTAVLNFALGRYGATIGTLSVFWEDTTP